MVIFVRSLLALAAGLPVVAAAADPGMMNLVMPDASAVVQVNVANIVNSPFGSILGEAFHQGFSQQMKAQLSQSKPEIQEKLAQLAQLDWIKDIQEVVVCARMGKTPSALIMVRSSLTPERVKAFEGWAGEMADYEGVPVLVSSKPGNGVVAFLDDSILVIGQPDDVKAAVHRRKEHAPVSALLTAQMAKYGQYDLWLATVGTLPSAPLTGPAANNPAGVQMTQLLSNIAGFNAGVKFSPDFELAANVDTRTLKAANDIGEGLRWFRDSMRAQLQTVGQSEIDRFKYQVTGRHIALSLHVPQQELLARMRTFRESQAAPKTAQAPASPSVVTTTPAHVDRPPAGMMRVQSSEGTVLIPVGKSQP